MDKQISEIIFANAVVDTWKDRVRNGECSFGEFKDAMIKNIKLIKQDRERDNDE